MEHLINKKAIDFRLKNNEKKLSPVDCYKLLEKLGVLTVFLPGGTESSISGMALKAGEHRFMMINSDMPLGRQHFTICHELYHLFEQENFVTETCSLDSFNKKDKNEYDADLFAMYLMLPEDSILSRIPDDEFEKSKISISTLLTIERDLQCSHLALLYRLFNLKIINKETFEKLKKIKLIDEANKLGFDTKLYSKGNENRVIGNYQALAQQAFDDEKISESHYISLLQDIFIDL